MKGRKEGGAEGRRGKFWKEEEQRKEGDKESQGERDGGNEGREVKEGAKTR